jgi:hypothetical protein
MMAGHGYQEASGTDSQNWVSGYTTQNIAFLAPVNINRKDHFQALATIPYNKGFDECLGASEPANELNGSGGVQTHAAGVWNYKTMSPCMVTPPIYIPNLCTQNSGG